MNTAQNDSTVGPVSTFTITPELCRAVFAELEAVHAGLSPDEKEVFGRHLACNGYALVAARMLRDAIENGLHRSKLVEWAARWADRAAESADSFAERRAIAEIRGYVASVDRLGVSDNEDEGGERGELEGRVCQLQEEAESAAVTAWALVLEAAVWTTVYERRGDPDSIPQVAGEILVRLMCEVCADDEARAAMVDDLRSFIERDRAQRLALGAHSASGGVGRAPIAANQNGDASKVTARDLMLAAKVLDASCNGSEPNLSRCDWARIERFAHEFFERAASVAAQGGPGSVLTPAEQLELACERAMIKWDEPLDAPKTPQEVAAGTAAARGVDAFANAHDGDWAGAVGHLEQCVALEREHSGPGAWAPVLELGRQLAAQVLVAGAAQ